MSNPKIPLVCVVGPTASGKTKLATELALKYCGEVVSGDSMQIYKEFEISTAKPSMEQMNAVKHYLVSEISVTEEFSVAKFTDLAREYIEKIYKNKKLPFLVGGTGLYIDSLLKNIKFEDNINDSLKVDLSGIDNSTLFSMLQKIDPESAQKIHVNNTKRLKRAIEFFYTSGYPISEQTKKSKFSEPIYRICKIGLNYRNRDILYSKINARVDEMFEEGILEEVRKVNKLDVSKTAQGAIGYKELIPCINGAITKEEACENLKQATRRYAKRQLTWFKRDEEINWIYIDDYSDFSYVVKEACKVVEKSGFTEI